MGRAKANHFKPGQPVSLVTDGTGEPIEVPTMYVDRWLDAGWDDVTKPEEPAKPARVTRPSKKGIQRGPSTKGDGKSPTELGG